MSKLATDLPGLQNLIKRDPQVYREEFMQQVCLSVGFLIPSMLILKPSLRFSRWTLRSLLQPLMPLWTSWVMCHSVTRMYVLLEGNEAVGPEGLPYRSVQLDGRDGWCHESRYSYGHRQNAHSPPQQGSDWVDSSSEVFLPLFPNQR